MAVGHNWKWMIISSFLLASWRCSNFVLRPSHASLQQGRPNQQPLTSSDETDENDSDGSVSPPFPTPSAFVPYGRTAGTVAQPRLVRQEAGPTSPTTDVGLSYKEMEELFWPEQGNGNINVDNSASCSQRNLNEARPDEEIHQLPLKDMLTVLTRNMPPTTQEENSALERLGALLAQALIKHLASASVPDASLAGILNKGPPPSRAPAVSQFEPPLPRPPVQAPWTGETNAYQHLQSHEEKHFPSESRSSRPQLSNNGSSNPFVTQKPPLPPRPSPTQETPSNGGTGQMRGCDGVSPCPPESQEELAPVSSRSISLVKGLREPLGAALPHLKLQREPSPGFRPPTPKDEKTTVPNVPSSPRCAESAPRAAEQQPLRVPSPKFRPPRPKDEKSAVPTGSPSPPCAESAPRILEQRPPRVPSSRLRPPTPKDQETPVRPAPVGPEPCREEAGDEAVKPRSVREQARLLNQDHVRTGMAAFTRNYQMLGGSRTGNANPRVQLPQIYTDETQEVEARAGKAQEANERGDDAPPPSERETADEKRPTPGNEGEDNVEEQREEGRSGKTQSTTSRSEAVPGQAPEEESVYEILYPIHPSNREFPALAVEPKHPDLATLLGYTCKTTLLPDINPDVLAQVLEVLNSSQREQSAASPEPTGSSVNENEDLSSGAAGGDSGRRRHKFNLFGLFRGNNKSHSDKDSGTSSLPEAMGSDTVEQQSSKEPKKKSPAGEGDRKRKLRLSRRPKNENDGTAAAGVQRGGRNGIHDESSTGDGNSSQEPSEPAGSFKGSDVTGSPSIDWRDTSSSSREQPARTVTETSGNLEGITKPNGEENGVPDVTTPPIGDDLLDKMTDNAVEEPMAVEGGGEQSQVTHHFTDQQSEDRESDSEHSEPSSVPRASGSSSSSGDQREGHLRSSSSEDCPLRKAPERRPRQEGLLRRWFSKSKRTADSAESEVPLLKDSATKQR